MHPFFGRMGVFSSFFCVCVWKKRWKMCENLVFFLGALKKIIKWEKILTDQPKYSEIPLKGNTTIFFFWPYHKHL